MRPLVVLAVLAVGLALSGSQAGEAKKVRLNPQIAALGDGGSVRLKTNEPSPLGRGYCARMPYDPARKIGLVYGACHNPRSIAQNDVWSFDASTATWTELVKSDPRKMKLKLNEFGVAIPVKGDPRPPGVGHTYSVICFDMGLGKLVSLRGGTPRWLGCYTKQKAKVIAQAKENGATDEIIKNARRCLPWLFDPKTRKWTLACPEGGDTPSHTRADACAYDPKHKRVLYWKADGDTVNRRGGVYAYDGAKNTWKFSPTKGGPPPGIEPLACWDSVNERVLYFFGSYTKIRQAKSFDYASLTWTNLEAKNWPKLAKPHPKRGPYRAFSANQACLAFDSLNGIALMFARTGASGVLVYPFDVRKSAFLPDQKIKWHVRGAFKCYYDPDQNAVVLNGGGDLGRSQTWAYRYKRAGKKEAKR